MIRKFSQPIRTYALRINTYISSYIQIISSTNVYGMKKMNLIKLTLKEEKTIRPYACNILFCLLFQIYIYDIFITMRRFPFILDYFSS